MKKPRWTKMYTTTTGDVIEQRGDLMRVVSQCGRVSVLVPENVAMVIMRTDWEIRKVRVRKSMCS